jgi:chromosome segregation ATPase
MVVSGVGLLWYVWSQDATIETQAIEIAKLKEELAKLGAVNKMQTNEMDRKDTQLHERTTIITNQQTHLNQRAERLAAQTTEIADQKARLDAQEKCITEQHDKLKQQANLLTQRGMEIVELKQQIAKDKEAAETALKAQADEIVQLKTQQAESDARTNAQELRLQRLEARMAADACAAQVQ